MLAGFSDRVWGSPTLASNQACGNFPATHCLASAVLCNYSGRFHDPSLEAQGSYLLNSTAMSCVTETRKLPAWAKPGLLNLICRSFPLFLLFRSRNSSGLCPSQVGSLAGWGLVLRGSFPDCTAEQTPHLDPLVSFSTNPGRGAFPLKLHIYSLSAP